MADRTTQVVLSMGCLKVAHALPATYHFSSNSTASPISSSDAASAVVRGPFYGLIICVTGLSKDARKQVQEATIRMGGQYSPDLHCRCTHLVVQNFRGRKYEHALKHGLKRGLSIVTVAWFVNCVKRNARLDESLYNVRNFLSLAAPFHELSKVMGVSNSSQHSCLPIAPQHDTKALSIAARQMPPQDLQKNLIGQGDLFSGFCFYIDMNSSHEFQSKIVEAVAKEGGAFLDHWFIGSEATHIVCEGSLMLKYLGFNVNLVTPYWIMKSLKERHLQRLVQLSADLARHVSVLLDVAKSTYGSEDFCNSEVPALCGPFNQMDFESQLQYRDQKVNSAKAIVRRRRGPRMQPCRTLPMLITPSILLDNICWSITDSPSAARFFSGSYTLCEVEDSMHERSGFLYDIREETEDQPVTTPRNIQDSAVYTRSMSESEKKEIVFRGSFLNVLFPVDRFGEMGPMSRCYHNEKGFGRQDILELIWSFYQEQLTQEEVEVALYTDSKHADKLRSLYATKEAVTLGYVPMRRFEFLGSRKSFEGLKRVGRENTSQLYELSLAA
ncbi:hypothetical protein KP509_24G003500 [Ceratopteris richardii]|uniref:BRCT domain-containing protein n=1 Tax=Ceratopteris richardii TaxID=49495 RepID=A0A8T2RV37_CERRI|nr:hypothetical protein KP509_24G003500 [Ceratopteris richardii]KAH7299280.1 hypothetical protein KP509_24G003500 [Ceratopteris richardii]KAH7299281.1 hypothetical protein KP509_24G003500 [Ceratopteris richardii]KAH7299282.1 hypothetical protein KP509_24G003500 [Ceratopteris richardii]KAH7299283.1 hypothetical protein KP509_24G003500 [Ceratopteris richardii]